MQELTYNATKTAAEFHQDNSFVRLQIGPVGCGKSVDSCIELWRRAVEQEAANDGIRYSRWAIIRNTYPELKSTTIKTWLDWFPERLFGKFKWSSPLTHHIQIDDIDAEFIFLALDSEADIKKLMSLELTGIYINEMQYLPKNIYKRAMTRLNRYPAKKSGARITWTGIIADTNPPDSDHWIYKTFEEDRPTNHAIFKFDPALVVVTEIPSDQPYATSLNGTMYINNPEADYINNLPDKNYYLQQVPGNTDDEIKVLFLGQYGTVMDGKPIHAEYNDQLHFSNKEIVANEHVEIGLGWDFGNNACAIVQNMPNGQLIVLAELFSDDLGLRDFAEYEVIPFLDKHYPFWRNNYVSRHDPAGASGTMIGAQSCQDILKEVGIKSISAADNNEPTARRDALKYFLRRLVSGQPGFLLNLNIKRLRKALMGGFQYARIRSANGEQFHDKPLKNMYSHIAEALEYIAMHYARNDKKLKVEKEVKPYRIHYGSFMGR
jgi:hypothetical protein